jgi:hypothetical protein
VPKATWEQSGFSLDVFERWLDEKFVVAAAEAEGVVALLPTVFSPFRNNLRRRRERELFEHSPGHKEAMEVRLLNKRACNGWYRRRHTGDLEVERVDLSGRWNDLEEESRTRSGRTSTSTRSGRTRLPSTRRTPIKGKEFRRANRARLAIAARSSGRSLARRSTVSQGSTSRDSNQSKKGRQLRQLPWPDCPLVYFSPDMILHFNFHMTHVASKTKRQDYWFQLDATGEDATLAALDCLRCH